MFAQPTSSGVRAVVQVSTVTARTSEGKVATFSDTAGRVFAVAYDEAGRVSTVLATRGRHFSDVLSIGYSTNGAVIGVMLGNGERLFFDYPRDGMQVIRTGKGGEIRRDAGRVIGSTADPDSDRLRSTVERLDALFFALGR
jgi:YD repeat-containing protein